MLDSDLSAFIDREHQAFDAILKGDPEPKKTLYSRRDDVSLANPFGHSVRLAKGRGNVGARCVAIARRYGTHFRAHEYSTNELEYIVEIERYHGRIESSAPSPNALRVTTIFRREHGECRILYRHADTITNERPPESIQQA